MNTATLLWGLLFSSIGLGLFLYGKRKQAIVPIFCGVALMVCPYFISSTLALVATGLVLMAVAFFVRI